MKKRTENQRKDYIVDLYSSLGIPLSFTYAGSPRKAVSSVIARPDNFPNEIGVKMQIPDNLERAENYAYEVPVIIAEDRKPIPQHQYELLQRGALASEMADRGGGSEHQYLNKAEQMLRAYRQNRAKSRF